MKNSALDDIKNYAARRLQQTYGHCGVADGQSVAFLNSGGDTDSITIQIKCEKTDVEATPVGAPEGELAHDLEQMRKDADLGRWLRLRAQRGWERFDIPPLPFVPQVSQLAQTLDEAVAAAMKAR